MNTDHTCPVREELHHAHTEFQHAAETFADSILGEGTRGHLRNAARHMLKAGLAAVDQAEARAHAAKGHPAPMPTPTAG